MNIQTFVYNENFYRKFALAIAILRLKPSHMSPREYTIELQDILRQKKTNEIIHYEKILLDVRSLRKSISTVVPTKCFDLLEHYKNFLEKIYLLTTEINFEIQIIIIETIDRIFQLVKENFFQIEKPEFEVLFKQLIATIFNYDIVPNIQKNSIERLRNFIDFMLIYIKQPTLITQSQMLIEHIGMKIA